VGFAKILNLCLSESLDGGSCVGCVVKLDQTRSDNIIQSQGNTYCRKRWWKLDYRWFWHLERRLVNYVVKKVDHRVRQKNYMRNY